MASYPFLVQVAWSGLRATLAEWQKEPDRWLGERDIQVEIASRLSNIYKLVGKDSVESKQTQKRWSRVSCEPYVAYTYSDEKPYRCHPDIVVWDDWGKKNDPNYEAGENWPILWACELKYKVKRPGTWDKEKLSYLVSQGHIRYGCWVTISSAGSQSPTGIEWSKDDVHKIKLWHCDVSLPPT